MRKWGGRLWAGTGTIRFQLAACFMALTFLLIGIMGAANYIFIVNLVQKKVSDSALDKLEKIDLSVTQQIQYVEDFMENLITDEEVTRILGRPFVQYNYRDVMLLRSLLRNGVETNSLISGVMISNASGHLYKNGQYIYLHPGEVEAKLAALVEASPYPRRFYWTGLEHNRIIVNSDGYVLSVAAPIRGVYDTQELGVLYVVLSPAQMYPLQQNGGSGITDFITDAGLTVIAHGDSGEIGGTIADEVLRERLLAAEQGYFTHSIGGEEMLVVFHTSPARGWKLVEYTSMGVLSAEIIAYRNTLLPLLLAMTALIGLLSAFLYRKITRPLGAFTSAMGEVEQGNFGVRVEVRSDNEIGRLARNFNHMVERLDSLVKEIYQQERRKKDTELEMLQMQINPHFLYNTLGALQWMAIIHKVDCIRSMTTSLIQLYKRTLGSSGSTVTLAAEVDMLRHYVEIFNIRYNNGIAFHTNIPPDLGGCLLPKFLLQPLVENAIIHGIIPKGSTGTIQVEAAREGDDLWISVIDDGLGMEAAKITALLEEREPGKSYFNAVGVHNVNERLVLYYGPDHGLQIDSGPERGTAVRLRIPITVTDGEEETQWYGC